MEEENKVEEAPITPTEDATGEIESTVESTPEVVAETPSEAPVGEVAE